MVHFWGDLTFVIQLAYLPMNAILLIIFVPAMYHAMIVGALDPHNPLATPNKWGLRIKTAVATLALIALLPESQPPPFGATFWGSFLLGQLVAPAFTSGDLYRPDEVPNSLERSALYWKSVFAGGIFVKLLSIVLFYATHWALGKWWFVTLLAFACSLIIGRVNVACLMLNSLSADELFDPKRNDRIAQLRDFQSAAGIGLASFCICCTFIGALVFLNVQLPPFGWYSWSGVLIGASLNALWP